eukprot:scaffold133268_cov59-Phaeocystis_antarctica.AAC.1
MAAALTMAILTMAILTMAILTLTLLTMAILNMAILTTAMITQKVSHCRSSSPPGVSRACTVESMPYPRDSTLPAESATAPRPRGLAM